MLALGSADTINEKLLKSIFLFEKEFAEDFRVLFFWSWLLVLSLWAV